MAAITSRLATSLRAEHLEVRSLDSPHWYFRCSESRLRTCLGLLQFLREVVGVTQAIWVDRTGQYRHLVTGQKMHLERTQIVKIVILRQCDNSAMACVVAFVLIYKSALLVISRRQVFICRSMQIGVLHPINNDGQAGVPLDW